MRPSCEPPGQTNGAEQLEARRDPRPQRKRTMRTAKLLGVLTLMLALPAGAQDILVTTDWAWQKRTDPKVRICEVSVDPGVYEKGHVPGAVGFKWHSELCDPVGRDIVSPEA